MLYTYIKLIELGYKTGMNKQIKHYKNKFGKNIKLFVVLYVLINLILPVCIKADEEDVSIEDYNGKQIGVLVGPLMEGIANEYFPDSKHLLFNTYPDCITALLTNKIDGYLADEPSLKMVCGEQPEISYIPKRLTENSYSFAFRKNDPESTALCNELNEFIRQCWQDGTMKEIDDIWFGNDEERKVVDTSGLNNNGRIIKVATTSTDAPFSYIKDGKNVGYDIDLVTRFCTKMGYGLQIVDVDFAGRIPEVESGKCDFTTDMNVTPERKEQVLFSEPTSYGGIVLAVRSSDLNKSNSEYVKLDDLDGKRIGVTTGSIHGGLVENRLPSADILYFSNVADLSAALKAKQIDAFACPYSTATFMAYEDDALILLDEHLKDSELAFATNKDEKGKKLNDELSKYVQKLKSDGSLNQIHDKWFSNDESQKDIIDYSELPNINGSLKIASDGITFPYTYVREDKVVGLEMDILSGFCKEMGYSMEVQQMNFDGILAAVQSDKCDIASSCLAITEERKQSVDFTETYAEDGVVLVVLNEATTEKTGFIENLRNSFYKTFLRENRYKLFIDGILTTMFITILSIVLGTLLGFVVFMICRNGNVLANTITKISIWIVQGMPMVVLLMVLYYIIFGSVSINGIAVAVIGFTTAFASAVYGLIRMAVGTIDSGQYEAAYALGHSNRETFYRIILPQAIPHVLPAYQSEVIGLLKATAIVGYIAVQDLTKMGDIVRSRTYEAFFPLIAVTIIYFVLEALLSFIMSKIIMKADNRKRKPEDILKGVRIHD